MLTLCGDTPCEVLEERERAYAERQATEAWQQHVEESISHLEDDLQDYGVALTMLENVLIDYESESLDEDTLLSHLAEATFLLIEARGELSRDLQHLSQADLPYVTEQLEGRVSEELMQEFSRLVQ